MNQKPNRLTQSATESHKPSGLTSAGKSDTKEIIFLATGLIALVLGIGGVLMYTEEKETPMTVASQDQNTESFSITTAFASSTPSSSPSSQTVGDHFTSPSSAPTAPTTLISKDSEPIDPTDLYFDFDRWGLTDMAKDQIKTQIEALPEEWEGTFHVQGHTDAQGTDTYNKALGLKRAEAVKNYLLSLGVAENSVQIESLGENGAICLEETADCYELNRRAHLAFVAPSFTQENSSQLAQLSSAPVPEQDSVPSPVMETEEDPVSQDSESLTSANPSSDSEDISAELVNTEPLMTAESQP